MTSVLGKPRRRRQAPKVIRQRHQTRTRILSELAKAGELTPREIAARTGETLGTVSYHVRTLHDAHDIELVRTSQVRGAIAHHYRLTTEHIDASIADLVIQRGEINTAIAALRRARKERS